MPRRPPNHSLLHFHAGHDLNLTKMLEIRQTRLDSSAAALYLTNQLDTNSRYKREECLASPSWLTTVGISMQRVTAGPAEILDERAVELTATRVPAGGTVFEAPS